MATTPPTVDAFSVSNARTTDLPTSPISFSHTVVAGTGALLVYVAFDNFFASIPIVAYGGVDVPLLQSPQFAATIGRPMMYLLPDPTPGTATLTVTAPSASGDSCAAIAHNILNYGGIRYGEWSKNDGSPFPYADPTIQIYAADTDLLICACANKANGIVFTPSPGQTALASQDGFADTRVKAATSWTRGVGTQYAPAVTTAGYSLSLNTSYSFYVLAIKGIDDAPPAGAPYPLGLITDTQTLGQQPNPAGTPANVPPGHYWRWPIVVPATHRFLAVLIEVFDASFTPVTEVSCNGVLLTLHTAGNNGYLWYLENAPVGTVYMEVKMSARRWFDAGTYCLAGLTGTVADIIAVVTRNSSADLINVPSSPGAIVIDLIKVHAIEDVTFIPASGNIELFEQPIRHNNPGQATDGTETGASSYRIADDVLTAMEWGGTIATLTNQQIGFSFLGGVNPCPGTVQGPYIDGGTFTPPVFPPCVGPGTRGDPPTGV